MPSRARLQVFKAIILHRIELSNTKDKQHQKVADITNVSNVVIDIERKLPEQFYKPAQKELSNK